MFKNSKAVAADGPVETLIGPKVVLQGDLHFDGGLYIEGRVVGRVIAGEDAKAVVTLAEGGSIEGEVRAPMVVVNGRVDGDIHASGRVQLAPKAHVTGDVHYQVVEMAAGAVLTGRLVHAAQAEAAEAEESGSKARLSAVAG